MFDFSNYSKGSKLFDETNKKVTVDIFVGLKPKMYSVNKFDGKESNTAKGVNNPTEFNKFKDVLCGKKIIRY